jgi:hypothetical protein
MRSLGDSSGAFRWNQKCLIIPSGFAKWDESSDKGL